MCASLNMVSWRCCCSSVVVRALNHDVVLLLFEGLKLKRTEEEVKADVHMFQKTLSSLGTSKPFLTAGVFAAPKRFHARIG